MLVENVKEIKKNSNFIRYDQHSVLFNCFLFFFVLAICSYLALMLSNCPYKDDYHRYLVNTGVGTISALRFVTFFMETVTYLSAVITDAAPFTQVLSCAMLAYSAVLCLKIFGINFQNKVEVLCFFPVVVNPYLLDVMMFRFDNVFIVLAFSMAVFAAYLSSLDQNRKKLLHVSVALLFASLFVYQAGLFAYLIIFMYLFMLKISRGESFFKVFFEMRYWIFVLAITTVLYVPFIKFIAYLKVDDDAPLLLIPNNVENIKIILKGFCTYFQQIWGEWSNNAAGIFCIILSAVFSLNFVHETAKNTTSVLCPILTVILIAVLFLSPSGIYYFMHIVACKERVIDPRIMYSIGIIISLLLLNNYRLITKVINYPKIREIYAGGVGLFCFWNVVFANSVEKTFVESFKLQNYVFHDVSKDVSRALSAGKNLEYLLLLGKIDTQKAEEMKCSYPMLKQLLSGAWNYSKIALLNIDFAQKLISSSKMCKIDSKDGDAHITGNNININVHSSEGIEIQNNLWYDTFSLDNNNNKILLIKTKSADKSRNDGDKKLLLPRIR